MGRRPGLQEDVQDAEQSDAGRDGCGQLQEACLEGLPAEDRLLKDDQGGGSAALLAGRVGPDRFEVQKDCQGVCQVAVRARRVDTRERLSIAILCRSM